MNMLQTWAYALKRSALDPQYYKELLKAPFSFSLKYLYILLVVLMLLYAVRFAVLIFAFLPQAPAKIQEFKTSVQQLYPPELVVKVTNGQVSTNVQEPYAIKLSSSMKDQDYDNAVVIDTNGRAEDYPKYRTFVLVTRDSVVYPDRSSSGSRTLDSYRVYPVRSMFKQDTTIDKNTYNMLLEKVTPFLNALPTILTVVAILSIVVFPFIAGGLVLLGKLLYLLIWTVVVFIIAQLMKRSYDYGKLFQLSLHGLTLPIILTFILGLLNVTIPMLYSLIFVVWMIVVLNGLPAKVKK